MPDRASDLVTVLGGVHAISQTTAAVSTAWLAAADFFAFLALVDAGVLGASATLDAKLEQATDGSGTGVKNVTGKAITQLTKAGSDDNKWALINLRPAELDAEGGFTHFRLTITPAVAACLISAVVLGLNARNAPETQVTAVDEVVG